MKTSTKVFLGIVLVMLLIKVFDLVVAPVKDAGSRTAVFSWIEIIVVAILGFIGLFFYQKLGFPELVNKKLFSSKGIILTLGLGFGTGIIFMAYDYLARIGNMSVAWPLSILFYIWGAISSEVIFRLFAAMMLTWLITRLIKKPYIVYWIIASLLSLFGAFSMLMSFSNPMIGLARPSDALFIILGGLVTLSELSAFWLMKRFGFLSNLFFRLSFYSIWHILWPMIFYV